MGKIMLRGMLASEHAATPHTQRADAYASDSQTTTSLTGVDMPNMLINMTTGAKDVLIIFTCEVKNNTAGDGVTVALQVDGSPVHGAEFDSATANQWGVLALSRIVTLTAGAHEIKVVWAAVTGGTAATAYRALQVIELKY